MNTGSRQVGFENNRELVILTGRHRNQPAHGKVMMLWVCTRQTAACSELYDAVRSEITGILLIANPIILEHQT